MKFVIICCCFTECFCQDHLFEYISTALTYIASSVMLNPAISYHIIQ